MATDTNQLALGDLLRDESVDRVGRHYSEFVERSQFWIKTWALSQLQFTTDDIWATLEQNIPHLLPKEPRAIGAAMTRAKNEGVIVPTGEYRKSRRAACHSRPVLVWKGAPWK